MRNRYKNLRITASIIAVILSFHVSIFAQNPLAGTDKYICAGQSTTIGGDAIPGACYAWTPDEGLSDPHSPNPTASPTSTTTYTVKVVGANFSFSGNDAVTVNIVEAIENVHIFPKDNKCCWKVGESISQDQFDITTYPPGLEGQIQNITITPSTAPSLIETGPTQNFEIKFDVTSLDCNYQTNTITKYVTIAVVDETYEISIEATADILPNVLGFITKVKPVFNALSFAPACVPSFSLDIGGTTKISKVCCTPVQGCIKNSMEGGFNGTFSAGIQCDFPVFFGLYGRIVANGSASLGLTFKTSCQDLLFCTSFSPNFSIGGGLVAGQPGALGASGVFVASINPGHFKYCLPSGQVETDSPTCISVKFIGEIFFMSFYKISSEIVLLDSYCF